MVDVGCLVVALCMSLGALPMYTPVAGQMKNRNVHIMIQKWIKCVRALKHDMLGHVIRQSLD
jgi:hypothetical protein